MSEAKKVTFTVIGEEHLGPADITDIADQLAKLGENQPDSPASDRKQVDLLTLEGHGEGVDETYLKNVAAGLKAAVEIAVDNIPKTRVMNCYLK